jgi:hypothetical protein
MRVSIISIMALRCVCMQGCLRGELAALVEVAVVVPGTAMMVLVGRVAQASARC